VKRIEAGLMARVQALLNGREKLPRAKVEGRPKLQVTVEGDSTDMLIYDEIGFWGVSAQDVAESLADVKGDLNVRLNSPGGDVFDGVAIYNMLADHDGQVTITVDGLAASAASFIAMAGDTIRMNRASQMMIHDASGLCIGNAADMTDMAGLLDTISDTIAGIYADRTGTAAADWRAAMHVETWYDAAEAVEAGLATEMAAPRRREEPAATFDLTVFQFAGRAKAPAPQTPDAGADADVTDPDTTAISSALSALKGAFQ
jgi:ATP-dependent protease ClpP protease subunit